MLSFHLVTVVLALFFLLSATLIANKKPAWLDNSLMIKLPMLNNGLVLLSAIFLFFIFKQYPFVNDWVTAKLIALILFIALAAILMRKKISGKPGMIVAGCAVACWLYLYAVGKTMNPWVFF
ncbi:SirB2 family protein [Pelagibaculum spongiae]|nr:SirB2 family protein [Pelagibaculum spongiae]